MSHISLPEISIIVIAKDEEKSIGRVLTDILRVVRQDDGIGPYELLLLDGCSRDDTAKIAERMGAYIFKVCGEKGDSIRKALSIAKGKYLLFIDADGSHIPEDIPRLLHTMRTRSCDMVIVSRMLGNSEELGLKDWDSLLRLLGNRLSTFTVNLRWHSRLTDIQNGFRIIRREVARELDLKESGFAIEQEMVMKCLKKNKTILEIPGIERKRLYGNSKVHKGRDFWRYLWSILKNL